MVKLENAQSVVRALRRQQFIMLGDQHKIGDHLTKSLEDSEKGRNFNNHMHDYVRLYT